MERLPTEVSSQIFKFLHQQDQVQCMLVSQKWAHLLKKSGIFHTVRISSMNSLHIFVEKLQKNTVEAAQVKNLILDVNMDRDFDLNSLSQKLPSLRTFYFNDTSQKELVHQLNTQQPWVDCIESLVDDNIHQISLFPITSSLPTNSTTPITNRYLYLKTLSVNVLSIPVQLIIRRLSNAPALSHLTLESVSIKFDELEALQSNLPSLTNLNLKTTDLTFGRLPYPIQPLNSVTEFSLSFMDSTSIEIQKNWLQYIRQKYTKLSDLSYYDYLNGYSNGDIPSFHEDGLIPLLHQLGPQLKSLSIASDIVPLNFVQLLDDAGCQIQHLHIRSSLQKIYQYFNNSSQLKFIRSFKICSLTLDIYSWLNQMFSLEELTILYFVFPADPGLNLDNLINACSRTLKSLMLLVRQLDIIENSKAYHPNIKKLTFSGTILPYYFDDYLSYSFPNLSYLKFNMCQFRANRLELPNMHLSHFEIVTIFPSQQTEFKLLVVTEEHRKWYVFKQGYHGRAYYDKGVGQYYPPYKVLPYNAIMSEPVITLICASVMNVVVLSEINGNWMLP
ncbi:hypothetical protein K501DRAFT_267972 [Backusella circina FSU 941]|nr:hypothetical protein K501DRAFT_267972 [Backusella circina FSU 941]